jgi:hypothetical protein
MGMHEVMQGECLASIAAHYGLPSWKTIYGHPQNASFRQAHPDPNVICPGESVFVPDKQPREEAGQTEARHEFRLQSERARLRLRLLDSNDKPLANRPYRIVTSAPGRPDIEKEGTTNGEGIAETRVHPGACEGKLLAWTTPDKSTHPLMWQLRIGHLDPIDTNKGVQGRLRNLGYDVGPLDGVIGPRTKAAVKEFQKDFGLAVDGVAGPLTKKKLKDVHGW